MAGAPRLIIDEAGSEEGLPGGKGSSLIAMLFPMTSQRRSRYTFAPCLIKGEFCGMVRKFTGRLTQYPGFAIIDQLRPSIVTLSDNSYLRRPGLKGYVWPVLTEATSLVHHCVDHCEELLSWHCFRRP